MSYTLASTIVTFPFLLILAVVHCCITWWLIGLPNVADTFFFFVFTVFSTIVAGSAFSTMFSVLVPNPMTGQTAGSGIFSAMMLFSGIFISRNDIPDWWIWMHYLSLFKYSFDSMATNVFADVTSSSPPMSNAEIKEFYGIQGVNRGTGVGVLWLFIIFFRLVFYHRLVTAFNGSRKK